MLYALPGETHNQVQKLLSLLDAYVSFITYRTGTLASSRHSLTLVEGNFNFNILTPLRTELNIGCK